MLELSIICSIILLIVIIPSIIILVKMNPKNLKGKSKVKDKSKISIVVIFITILGIILLLLGIYKLATDLKTKDWIETKSKTIIIDQKRNYENDIITNYRRSYITYIYTYEYTDKEGVVHRGKNSSKKNSVPSINVVRYNPNNYSESMKNTLKSDIIEDSIYSTIGLILLIISIVNIMKKQKIKRSKEFRK